MLAALLCRKVWKKEKLKRSTWKLLVKLLPTKARRKLAKARLDKSDEEAINAAKAAAFLKEDEEA